MKIPTQLKNILDKIVTNLADYYDAPFIMGSLGSSNHVVVMVKPYYIMDLKVTTDKNLSKMATTALGVVKEAFWL